MPRCTVIPELAYPDVGKAIEWLCNAFGFTLRIGMGAHRAQLNVGDGAVVLTELHGGKLDDEVGTTASERSFEDLADSVMVRVDDVDRHCERARHWGARIVRPPADYPYGERQYTVEDLAGRCWTFSQSIADVIPEEWGGMSGKL